MKTFEVWGHTCRCDCETFYVKANTKEQAYDIVCRRTGATVTEVRESKESKAQGFFLKDIDGQDWREFAF
jgi:hypothetical protein